MRNNALVRQNVSRFGKEEPPKRVTTEKVVRLNVGAARSREPLPTKESREKLRPGLY
jgi:hypothetical protein